LLALKRWKRMLMKIRSDIRVSSWPRFRLWSDEEILQDIVFTVTLSTEQEKHKQIKWQIFPETSYIY
jgi:hypothetical protein